MNTIERLTGVLFGVSTIGLDFYAIIGLIIKMLDRENINDLDETNLYDREDLKGARE